MPREPRPVPAPGPTTPMTGQPHGQRAEQEAQIAAVPPAGAGPDPSSAAKAMPFAPVGLSQPPEGDELNVPETAGLPFGAGPGPEALQLLTPQPAPPANASDLERLRPLLASLELLSSRPGASETSRQLVRTLRSQMPGQAG